MQTKHIRLLNLSNNDVTATALRVISVRLCLASQHGDVSSFIEELNDFEHRISSSLGDYRELTTEAIGIINAHILKCCTRQERLILQHGGWGLLGRCSVAARLVSNPQSFFNKIEYALSGDEMAPYHIPYTEAQLALAITNKMVYRGYHPSGYLTREGWRCANELVESNPLLAKSALQAIGQQEPFVLAMCEKRLLVTPGKDSTKFSVICSLNNRDDRETTTEQSVFAMLFTSLRQHVFCGSSFPYDARVGEKLSNDPVMEVEFSHEIIDPITFHPCSIL